MMLLSTSLLNEASCSLNALPLLPPQSVAISLYIAFCVELERHSRPARGRAVNDVMRTQSMRTSDQVTRISIPGPNPCPAVPNERQCNAVKKISRMIQDCRRSRFQDNQVAMISAKLKPEGVESSSRNRTLTSAWQVGKAQGFGYIYIFFGV